MASKAAVQLGKIKISNNKVLGLLGFKALLAWHYLVLFSPVMISPIQFSTPDSLFQRQLVLYLSIALTFALFIVWGKRYANISRDKAAYAVLFLFGALAALATFFSVVLSSAENSIFDKLGFASVVFLGMSEAALMALWLLCKATVSSESKHKSFAIDMICGALIGFLVCNLQAPLSYIAVVALPLISTISLFSIIKPGVHQSATPEQLPFLVASKRVIRLRFFKNLTPSLVFALVIGLLQGSYLTQSITLLMISTPLIILGIVVSGLLIFIIPKVPNAHTDIDSMHRLSLVFVALGVLWLITQGSAVQSLLSQTAVVAGFNLFDFGALTLSIAMIRSLHLGAPFFIGSGRSLVYLCFAIGLITGYFGMQFWDSPASGDALLVVSVIALTLLIITIVIPLRKPEEDIIIPASMASVPHPQASKHDTFADGDGTPPVVYAHWKAVCTEVSKNYQLSPREFEVFLLVAKGRNAEHIQDKLVISPHTAKTHIANIYRKLDVHSQQEVLDLIESFRNKEMK